MLLDYCSFTASGSSALRASAFDSIIARGCDFVDSVTGILSSGAGVLTIDTCNIVDNTTGVSLTASQSVLIGASYFASTVPLATLLSCTAASPMVSFEAASNQFVVDTGQIGASASASAFNTYTYRLNANDFSGAGTFLSGLTAANSQANFVDNVGTNFANTSPRAFASIFNGAAATALTTGGVYYKIVAALVTGDSQLFTVSGNSITNTSGRTLVCYVVGQVDGLTSAASGDYNLAVVKNGTSPLTPPSASIVGVSFGRGSSSSLPTVIVETQVTLANGDKVELFIRKTTTNNTTFTCQNASFSVRPTSL